MPNQQETVLLHSPNTHPTMRVPLQDLVTRAQTHPETKGITGRMGGLRKNGRLRPRRHHSSGRLQDASEVIAKEDALDSLNLHDFVQNVRLHWIQ